MSVPLHPQNKEQNNETLLIYTIFSNITFYFSQETIKDSLQELPKPEQKAYRKAQLERALSKI